VRHDAEDWQRAPGQGRYARPERERRFLVADGAPSGGAARLIEDTYLDGLRLRLRRVSHGGRTVHKLTQKVRPDETDPAEVLLTNMYLSAQEFARLLTLPGATLVKTRTLVAGINHTFAVDDFQGPLAGLRLVEVEVADLAEPVDLPAWVGREVTHDDRFSGGSLARLEAAAARQLIDRVRH
jgi:CYTH domain-containing protein